MKKFPLLALVCLLAGVMVMPGCSSATKVDPAKKFIAFSYKSNTTSMVGGGIQTITGSKDGVVYLGMPRADVVAAKGAISAYSQFFAKYDENDNCISMMIANIYDKTLYNAMGVGSNYADIIPAYSVDPDVVVELDTPQKVILSKMIDGVKYTVTFRNYASDNTVKTFTITNTSLYTESEDDYPAYAQ